MSSKPDPWRILLSKTDLAEGDVRLLSEQEAWKRVYALPRPTRNPQVCFTGFGSTDRQRLETVAKEIGLEPKDSVTKGLILLVTGPNAGESKVKKAQLQKAFVTDEDGFYQFVATRRR